mmetsp:Transcript_5045/g.5172  ORF Transcript_5045/g.5172 Transcript_5045/m.5172 type:complete len:292 (-) Transcript_5045:22-897(-)|eukprot:CAMPEP_0119042406 /NCGR_PEP_ID=MMETSP1177-20130426/15061_1 /TAXON_ID=2985 /ORGANISM="Ochromonas sp, Strain CCMP1899" /LENGTH=291 /DNA_ID=CAMNT_0007009191 /DNA_START=117 /DNA_END=989 /DNA_ORIENTATION=+
MKSVHHYQRATIADLINPDEGHRGEMLRKGRQIKDHMKENRVNLRESEIRGRELRELSRQPEKEPFKLAQFRGVSAKVFEEQESPRKNTKPANDGEFLTKGVAEKRREDLALENRLKREELDRKMSDARYIADRPSTPRKNSVPKATDIAKLAERRNSDFINKNRIKAATMIPHQSQENKEPSRHQNFGRVPNYLEQRKQQWRDEKEEIKRRAPDPNCPKGMCLMPEIERQDTLEILHSSKAEALKQLQALPFVIETPSLKKRQQGLEDKLREIEKAVILFSKPKVYIANE